jgi:hypothetical protein
MDQSTNLQRSFDSGRQGVGSAPFTEYWYKFEYVAPPSGGGLTGFVATGSDFQATITVLDSNLKPLGPLNGLAPRSLKNGTHYIHVTASSHTFFHFGVVAPPSQADFPNDVGHSSTAALNLGQLQKVLTHSSSFYTYFTRNDPAANSTAQGALVPDFSRPNPKPPLQTDFYSFSVSDAGPVKLIINSGPFGEPVKIGPGAMLTYPNGTRAPWANNQTVDLTAGNYVLQIVDQRTSIAGNATFRNAQFEDFENYTLELLFKPWRFVELDTGWCVGKERVVWRRSFLRDRWWLAVVLAAAWLFAAAKQRSEHFLQSRDEMVGLAGALGKVFNLVILDANLLTEERVLAFEALDVGCRDWSRDRLRLVGFF